MALDLKSRNRTATLPEDAEGFFALLAGYGLRIPVYDFLRARLYDDPQLSSTGDIADFRAETVALVQAHGARRRRELIQEKNIRAANPVVLERILAPMLARDPVLVCLGDILALCDDALATGGVIRGLSD